MNLDQLQAGLMEQERFAPDLDAVRERVRRATPPSTADPGHRTVWISPVAIAASVAVVAILAGVIAVVHNTSQPARTASPPSAVVGGIHWKLTAATISGMPNGRGTADDPESLYLYPDGTSVATGFCLARQGKWHQNGTEVIFSDQFTLDHSCPLGMNSTAPRQALLQLDGPMSFTLAADVLHLRNSTTTMTFTAAGDATTGSGPTTGVNASPIPAALTGFAWQLSSAAQNGGNTVLSPDKSTTMTLYADGTSTMAGPACFYRTGRWHQITGGIALTDQVGVAMGCYAITDPREEAGGSVLAGLVGDLSMTVTQHTLTLHNAHTTAHFTDAGVTTAGPASSDTTKPTR